MKNNDINLVSNTSSELLSKQCLFIVIKGASLYPVIRVKCSLYFFTLFKRLLFRSFTSLLD